MKKLYKLTTLLIAITLSTGLMAQTSTPPSNYATSDGSSGDPYFISSLDNLYWLSQTSGDWDKYFKQTTDIDASTTSGWDGNAGFSPIGNGTTKFTGSYDGQDKTISNLTINRSGTSYIGLFGYTINITIQNLGLPSVSISGNQYVGALIGKFGGTITNCYTSGTVTAASHYAGGFVGFIDNTGDISTSYSNTNVDGASRSGGFTSNANRGVNIENCYSLGDVTLTSGSRTDVGSFLGYDNTYTGTAIIINNCYATGDVTFSGGGTPTDRGFAGEEHGGTFTNNFFDSEASNQTTATGATAKTTAQMKNVATFTLETTVGLTTAWDFIGNPNDDAGTNDYWSIDGTTNSGYPFLSWETQCWDGGNGKTTDWFTTSNWQSGSVPTSTDNVSISNTTTMPVISGSTTAECNDLVVASGSTLTIEDDGKLTASGDMTNNGTLTLESTISGTGSLIVNGTAAGSVDIQRHIVGEIGAADGWHFLSSPVASQAISSFHTEGSGDDFYSWDEENDEWVNRTASGGGLNGSFETNFTVGKGYLIANSSTSIKTFSGILNNSTVSVTGLNNTDGNTYAGFHLLGNPFPCALDFNEGSWSKSGTIGTYAQIWNESAASYKVLAGEQIIPAMNGFMVYTSGDGASLTIPTDARVHSDTNWYKSSMAETMIALNIVDPEGNTSQQTLIDFNPDATDGFNPKYDALYMSGFAPMFYSSGAGKLFALNCLPEYRADLEIPLGFIKNQGTGFYIQLQRSLPDITVYLTDLKTNFTQNLSNNPVYSFTSEEGDDSQRFLLHFKAVGIEDQPQNQSNIQTWAANNTIHILNPENLQGEIRILNLFGQQVAQAKLTGDTKQQIQLNVPTGCYLVNVISEKGVVTRKVMVN